ncbi:tyrosine-type recombinase/integrase [Fundidesulfovibrio agrisoli]|uniref:tyrosine-type recombinase/integrase n=1 Tax=Fundidesulfovibrio agrisoli TaxID=2922717 RepID=UPI001FADF833|nr:integrase arm-type DNA-binding domain-containing protein [Fundidesulfovibrio agrisoli]
MPTKSYLTDIAVKNAKPGPKPYKMADERGLVLEVRPNGGKWWRLRYRFEGKEKMLSLGVYPDVALKEARERRDEARKLLANGVDPSQARKDGKALEAEQADTFEAVAREWHARIASSWTERTAKTNISRLELDVFPFLGRRQIKEISASELLAVLRRVESRGAEETARRLRTLCGQVFRYAVATGRCERDPASDLRGALSKGKPKNFASITDPREVAALLRAIDGYSGTPETQAALKLAPLTFVRPGELRRAEWSEFDLEAAEWRIPAEKMKMREAHIVPLSKQAVAILRELQPLTGRGRYCFPSGRTQDRPMSENTINAALRRLGYSKEEMTGHGFRAMASTLLHEQGWPSDVIERQLAHAERNKVKAAYNRAGHLPERRKMMQAWAEFLAVLKSGVKVVPIHRESVS